jgi:hypothetical protein
MGWSKFKIRICPSNITHASMTLDKYVRLNSEKKRECQYDDDDDKEDDGDKD